MGRNVGGEIENFTDTRIALEIKFSTQVIIVSTMYN